MDNKGYIYKHICLCVFLQVLGALFAPSAARQASALVAVGRPCSHSLLWLIYGRRSQMNGRCSRLPARLIPALSAQQVSTLCIHGGSRQGEIEEPSRAASTCYDEDEEDDDVALNTEWTRLTGRARRRRWLRSSHRRPIER